MLRIIKNIFPLKHYLWIFLKKWGIYIKLNSKILGICYIKIDKNFGAGNYLWIDAIYNYYGTTYTPKISIGENVSLGNFCHIAAINRIEIGSHVLIGRGVHITDHSYGNYTENDSCDSPDTLPIFRKLIVLGQ